MRLDTWLWVVRLAKTRPLAAEAVKGGKVHVNGARVKPAREVAVGDEVEATIGDVKRTVVVRGLAPRRVSAAVAATLYEETAESIAAREARAAALRIAALASPQPGPRPTKRDRRRYDAFRGRS